MRTMGANKTRVLGRISHFALLIYWSNKVKTFKTSAQISTLFLTLALGVASLSAFAGDMIDANNQAPLAEAFSNLDKNADSSLSRSEASKDKLFTRKNFTKADTNHDGVLNQDEYSTFKSAAQKKAVKLTVADSTITAKAKAKILGTEGLKSMQISVETHKGEVILSGFVDSEAAKTKAEQVVAQVKGVQSVKNSLEVKN